MSKTLGNLRTGVRVYLDESNQQDFLDTEVLRSINYAYHDVISEVLEVYEKHYNTTTPVTVSTFAAVDGQPGQQEYSFNPNVLKITRVEINYNPADVNSKPVRAKQIDMNELPLSLSDNSLGGSSILNAGYYINGSQSGQIIGFVPIPTHTGTNNVSIWGTVAPDDMVNDSDTVNIPYPDRFAQLIELKAAADLLRKGQQQEEPAARYMAEYMAGITRMKTFLKERAIDGPVMIEDAALEDVSLDWPLGTIY